MSLTAAGLALPPVAFMTWPTNQPSDWGFSATPAALSGLAAMISSMAFSIAPVSVTCLRPCFSTTSVGEPSPFQTWSKTSLAILEEITLVSISSTSWATWAAGSGFSLKSLPSAARRAETSLVTQLDTNFASLPLAAASK